MMIHRLGIGVVGLFSMTSPLDRPATGSVTVALIGCGAVSKILYGPALARLEAEGSVRVIGAVDPSPERTDHLRQLLPAAAAYRSADELLPARLPELAIVAAPHCYHVDLAEQCLSRGIAVLCEKPMALTSADCDRMIAAADTVNSPLAVGHFRRFFWSCQAIKRIIDTHLLGRVQSFTFLEGETYSWPAASASFFDRKQAGGGVLIDAGAHLVDLLLWWLGEVAELTYADDAMGGVEANCFIELRMKSGATGTVQLSRDWALPNRYVIECENGWVAYLCDVVDRIEFGTNDSSIVFDAKPRTTEPSSTGPNGLSGPAPNFMECFENQIRNVVAALRTGKRVAVSGSEGRKTVAFIEQCYQNRQPLAMPWLSDEEQRRARQLAHV